MESHILGIGFTALFIAAVWIILMLWAIYRALTAILNELRRMNDAD
jgi:hypothetical protein